MRLKEAQITNLSSVEDSSEFTLADISCLVGKNETEAQAGDVIVARLYNWHAGTARTVLRIFQPPYLVAAATDPTKYRPELVDNERVVVKAVVVGSFRLAAAAAA